MTRKTMKRILVTGATGQIGSELAIELRRKYGNHNVIAAGHKRAPSDKLFQSGPFEYVDVTDKASIEKVVRKHDIDTVYHWPLFSQLQVNKTRSLLGMST